MTAKWDKAGWATKQSALLSGRALDVYTRLSEEAASGYSKVNTGRKNGFTSNLLSTNMMENYVCSRANL